LQIIATDGNRCDIRYIEKKKRQLENYFKDSNYGKKFSLQQFNMLLLLYYENEKTHIIEV